MRVLAFRSIGSWAVGCVWLAGAAITAWGAAPIVSNVTAEQRVTPGRGLEITYDLDDPDGDLCTITVEIVDPAGVTIRPQLLFGDVGPDIPPGTGKHVIWDAMRDLPGRFGTRWRARVIADDGQDGDEILYSLPGTTESIVMVRVPAGDFPMGALDVRHATPVHTVYLDEYWIMRYPVTVAQWRVYATENGLAMPSGLPSWEWFEGYMEDPAFDNYPMIEVSWSEAAAFASWAGLDLPTEAQWEKAARGTDERVYPWGNEEYGNGNVYRCNLDGDADGFEYIAPVGSFGLGISPYGLFDMAGNVAVWCADWYGPDYFSETPPGGWVNPRGPDSGGFRTVRGSAWSYSPNDVQSAWRGHDLPDFANEWRGARFVRNP